MVPSVPRGRLEIKCLSDRAMRDQTTKRFSEPPEHRTGSPGPRPSTPGSTTPRENQTVKPSPHFPSGRNTCERLHLSRATVRKTVLGQGPTAAHTAPLT